MPEYAALANGIAAHGIEMDDVNNESSLHAAVTVFPTALAMADLAAVTGKSFITAVVVGYDVATRLGRALKPAAHYRRGFHPTATCGTFAAATVAARLFGLKADGIASALGIAGSQAAGNLEFLAEGAWTKRVQAGWPAHCGIWAGLLARAGYVGPATIIEGRDGFLHDYSDESDPGLVLPDLGQVFHATRTSIKPHACCRYNQGPIDCLLDLKRRYDFEVEDVKEVRVGLLTAAYNTVAVPQEEKRNPFNIVDVQFSMPFASCCSHPLWQSLPGGVPSRGSSTRGSKAAHGPGPMR